MAINSRRMIFRQAAWALVSSNPNSLGLRIAFKVGDVKPVGSGRTPTFEIVCISLMEDEDGNVESEEDWKGIGVVDDDDADDDDVDE